MLPVEIINVAILEKRFVIFLKSPMDKRTLPIFIDEQQAQSILIQINKIEIPRPLTHDLFKKVLDSIGCELLRIEVSDLINDTFYARMVIDFNGKIFDFDARPSDAICLALRFGAPMYVDEKVMERAGIILTDEEQTEDLEKISLDKEEKEIYEEDLKEEDISPLEKLKKQLERAIKEERYEDAAKIRDELKKINNSN
jgi:bifunctional DNase/RNase